MVTKTMNQSTGSRLDMVKSISTESNVFSRSEIYLPSDKSKLFIISDICADGVSKQVMVLSDDSEKYESILLRIKDALFEAGISVSELRYYGRIYVDTKARFIAAACASSNINEEPGWECISRLISEGIGNTYDNFNITLAPLLPIK